MYVTKPIRFADYFLTLAEPSMYAIINAASVGSNEVVAAVANKRIRVLGYLLTAAGTVQATWKSASTSISGPLCLANGSGVHPDDSGEGLFETAVGEALNLSLDGVIRIGGHLVYRLIG